MPNVRHLCGEDIQMYEVHGQTERKILKRVRKLLKLMAEDRPYGPTLFSVSFQLDGAEELYARVVLSVA